MTVFHMRTAVGRKIRSYAVVELDTLLHQTGVVWKLIMETAKVTGFMLVTKTKVYYAIKGNASVNMKIISDLMTLPRNALVNLWPLVMTPFLVIPTLLAPPEKGGLAFVNAPPA